MEVTRVEQRSYIKIAVLRGKNAMGYHSELVEALGNNVLPYRTVSRIEEDRKPDADCREILNLGDQSFILTNLGCVDEEMVPPGRGISQAYRPTSSLLI
ncbi:hypothetical protein TNCV_3973301 [Trichonephila clavipes]|nr:hypothetical protein TNCV_3973301 [Trichonephila clavipes]